MSVNSKLARPFSCLFLPLVMLVVMSQMGVMDTLSRLSHDSDAEVAMVSVQV